MHSNQRGWIPITEAIDLLAERYFDYVAPIWGIAYASAWQAIEESLVEGNAQSRASFVRLELQDSEGSTIRSMDAQPDGLILAKFWLHYREAKMTHSNGLVTVGSGPGSHQSGNDVWYLQSQGIIDGLHLLGEAKGLEINASSVPRGVKSPRLRGRPKFDDQTEIERILAVVRHRQMSAPDAVARYWGNLKGNSENAKKTRARKELRRAGLWP